MSSPVDLAGIKGKVAYCISKIGMAVLVMGLAGVLKGSNIDINAL